MNFVSQIKETRLEWTWTCLKPFLHSIIPRLKYNFSADKFFSRRLSAILWVLLTVTVIRQQCIPTEHKCRLIHLLQKALLNDIVTGRKTLLENTIQGAALWNSKQEIDFIILNLFLSISYEVAVFWIVQISTKDQSELPQHLPNAVCSDN